VIAFSTLEACLANRRDQVRVTARLGDSEDERLASQSYRPRWRLFLACLNLLQFCNSFNFFTTSEVAEGVAPDVIPPSVAQQTSGAWIEIREEVITAFRSLVDDLATAQVPIPEAAYEVEEVEEDAIAELAWPNYSPPVAVLAGEQIYLASKWQDAGWQVVTSDDIQVKGINFLINLVSDRCEG